ncbi:hypothetical protein JW796_04540 [Candidatus Dojkabacteria bacterium]|nr:hypothetical protein [Candidatus Dojkabacteria bacterium]
MDIPGEVPNFSLRDFFSELLEDSKHKEIPTRDDILSLEDESCDYCDEYGTEYYFRGNVIYVRTPAGFSDNLRNKKLKDQNYAVSFLRKIFSIAGEYSQVFDEIHEDPDYLFYFVSSTQNSPDLCFNDIGIQEASQGTSGKGINKNACGCSIALAFDQKLGMMGRIITNSSLAMTGDFQIVTFEGRRGENVEEVGGYQVIKKDIVKSALNKAYDIIVDHSSQNRRNRE